ncbi:hypothetical protein [Legionella maceachernii]|nr:hypothetical protein [Legionella maceachernii]SJZ51226.1 hypothetical protein SAMN02745128_00316 [Legionella maceachernii]SUP03696.1 Uncharacterised protein [Legionella maceachernii]
MTSHFTETEIERLRLEKENLLQPINYFFRQLKSLDEFADICSSMLSLQWELFKSGAYATVEIFRTLRETASLLWEFNFSLAGGKLCEAGKNALIALEKFALALSLLLLHTIRLLTILVATFFPHILILSLVITVAYFTLPLLGVSQIGALVLGAFIGCCGIIAFSVGRGEGKLYAEAAGKSIKKEFDEYDKISEEIFEERRQIIEAIKNACSNRNVSSNNQCQFFQVRTPSGNNLRLKAEADEFSQELHELVNNYPKFKADRARTERGYIRKLTRELEQHHAKTKEAAEFFLGQIQNVRDRNSMAYSSNL